MLVPTAVSVWGLRVLYGLIVVWLCLGRARDSWRLFVAHQRAEHAEDQVAYLQRRLNAADAELFDLRRAELVRQAQREDTSAAPAA